MSWLKNLLTVMALLILGVMLTSCGDDSTASTHPTIGLITNNPNGLRNVQGFIDGMEEFGYIEGDTVHYLFASEPTSGPDLEQELERFVAGGVDLIFTAGTPTGVAAHRITADSGTPVVFGVIADPLRAGVMEDLSHPGGNMTGVQLEQNQIRRLELLIEIAPMIQRILVPYNPTDAAATSAVEQIAEIAPDLGVELVLAEALSSDDVVLLLEDLPDALDAIFLVPDSTVNAHLSDILAVARDQALATSGPSTAQIQEGALMTYGFVHEKAGAQAARIANQVLRGANAGDLPVEDTESILGINLVTAAAIDLEITDAVLQRAEVIIRSEAIDRDGG